MRGTKHTMLAICLWSTVAASSPAEQWGRRRPLARSPCAALTESGSDVGTGPKCLDSKGERRRYADADKSIFRHVLAGIALSVFHISKHSDLARPGINIPSTNPCTASVRNYCGALETTP